MPFPLWASVFTCVQLGLREVVEELGSKSPSTSEHLATQQLPTALGDGEGEFQASIAGSLLLDSPPYTFSPSASYSPYLSSLIPFPSIALSLFNSLRAHKGRGNCPRSADEAILLSSWPSWGRGHLPQLLTFPDSLAGLWGTSLKTILTLRQGLKLPLMSG